MCGIFGLFGEGTNAISKMQMEACAKSISHRGPDHTGYIEEDNYKAASVRLSIIDLNTGDQPVYSADHRYSIVYNGEVYNYQSLRCELEDNGVSFHTKSDTEVLLQMYIVFGKQMLPRLEGQFAFLIYDKEDKVLFGARDSLGICPFYYSRLPSGGWAFASEVKAFEPLDFPFEFDPTGLQQIPVFWGTIPPRTCWKNISELPISHCFTLTNGGVIKSERYFSINKSIFESESCKNITEAVEHSREILFSEINKHLVSDVAVGSYLSGGIDSSVLAAVASRFTDKLNTFSVGFDDDTFDEGEAQKQVLEFIPNAEHHHLQISSDDIVNTLPRVLEHTEKPLFRTAPVPLFLLSQETSRAGIKVVLTGEGSDEMFLGYDTFRELLIRKMWSRNPESEWRPELFSKIFPYFPQYQNKRTFQFLKQFYKNTLADVNNPLYPMLPRFVNGIQIQKLCLPELIASQEELYSELNVYIGFTGEESLMEKCQLIELHTLLPGYLLSSQGDRMLMAHSVEGRYPYLSNRLSRFLWKQPDHWKLSGLKDKYLLRNAVKGIIPESVRLRPKFAYRSPDINAFFPNPPRYIQELLSKEYTEKVGVFNPESVQGLFNKFSSLKENCQVTLKDSVAFVWILTTHLLHFRFVEKCNINDLDLTRIGTN